MKDNNQEIEVTDEMINAAIKVGEEGGLFPLYGSTRPLLIREMLEAAIKDFYLHHQTLVDREKVGG